MMLAAQKLCEEGGQEFQDVFSRQYCLSRKALPHVAGWKHPQAIDGWSLTFCPKLDYCTLQDRSGRRIGWLLGTAIDQQGDLVGKQQLHVFPVDQDNPDFWDVVEGEITQFAGRYLVIILTDTAKRVYFDPVMDLPAVFNRKERTVAASPLMALWRSLHTNRRIPRRAILKQGGNYGLQQTCDPDVIRGISNHYLDLDSFALHRHWPREDDDFAQIDSDLDAHAAGMVARLGQVAGAILENYACAFALSGGGDSRTLAFAAKDKMHLAKMAYSHRTIWISQFDCFVAQKVAAELGIAEKFTLVDALGAIEDGTCDAAKLRSLRWNFCYRTGYLQAAKNGELPLSDMVPPTDYVLRGNILDMARANQWRNTPDFELAHGIKKLAIGGRTREQNVDYWGPEYLNWVDTLPQNTRHRIYDFAFLEQLLPNTLGGRLIGYHNAAYINPFNDRSLITTCLRVAPALRKKGLLNKAMHQAAGVPEMLSASEAMQNQNIKAEAEAMFG